MTTIYRRDRSARPDRTPNPGRLLASPCPHRWHRSGSGNVNLHVRRAGSANETAGPADTGTYSDVKDPVVDPVIAVAEA